MGKISFWSNGTSLLVHSGTVTNQTGNEIYAAKLLFDERNKLKAVQNEIQIHSMLDHDNIIKLKQWFYDSNAKATCLLMELCKFSLHEYQLSRDAAENPLNENECKSFIKQILNGLQYLHGKNVIHRDLRPANILMVNHQDVRICDFGLACFQQDANPNRICGTKSFIVPEVIKVNGYTPK